MVGSVVKNSNQRNSCRHRENAIPSRAVCHAVTSMNRSLHRRAAELSRDRNFLIRASLLMVGVSATIALLLSFSAGNSPKTDKFHPVTPSLGVEDPSSLEQLISFFRFREDYFRIHPRLLDCRYLSEPGDEPKKQKAFDELLESLTSQEDVPLIEIWSVGFKPSLRSDSIERLQAADPSLRYRNEFLGDLHYLSDKRKEALEFYLTEVENFPDSLYSRRSVLYISRWTEDHRFQEFLQQPEFLDALRPYELLNTYADLKDFANVARLTLAAEWTRLTSISLIPGLFVAAIWFCILATFWTWTRTRAVAALIAFTLGIVSAGLTLFCAVIQERTFGFVENSSDTPLNQVIYWIAGVGLREETLKLLCFVPIAFWTAKRKSDIEALILAAMVGLGFAFQENIGYFDRGLDDYLPFSRLLKPSVLHFSLTGIAGLYLHRMLAYRMRGWENFLFAFIAVVFAHGFYDAVLTMQLFASYEVLSPIFIALFAYQFFDPLRLQMDQNGLKKRVSPLGIFILGCVALTCIVLIGTSPNQPFNHSLGNFAVSVASMVPLAFAFISRFRDL